MAKKERKVVSVKPYYLRMCDCCGKVVEIKTNQELLDAMMDGSLLVIDRKYKNDFLAEVNYG